MTKTKKLFILFWGLFTLIQLIAPGFSFAYAAVLLFLAIPVIFLGVRIHCRAGAYFVEVLIFIFSFLLPSLFIVFYLLNGFPFSFWIESVLIAVGFLQIFFLFRILMTSQK